MALEQSNVPHPARIPSRGRRRPPEILSPVADAASMTAAPAGALADPAAPVAGQVRPGESQAPAGLGPARPLLPVPPMGQFTAYLVTRLIHDPSDDMELTALIRARYLRERCAEFAGLPGELPLQQ